LYHVSKEILPSNVIVTYTENFLNKLILLLLEINDIIRDTDQMKPTVKFYIIFNSGLVLFPKHAVPTALVVWGRGGAASGILTPPVDI
jgi:hypothetical protein